VKKFSFFDALEWLVPLPAGCSQGGGMGHSLKIQQLNVSTMAKSVPLPVVEKILQSPPLLIALYGFYRHSQLIPHLLLCLVHFRQKNADNFVDFRCHIVISAKK